MKIERNKNELVIRLAGNVDAESIQQVLNYFRFQEMISGSKGDQKQADALSKDVKNKWWDSNKDRFQK